MIKIEITADSTQELQKELRQLLGAGEAPAAPAVTETTQAPAPEPEPAKPARTRARKEETPVIPINTADPLGAAPVNADPLGSAPAPSADPLGTSAPVADPLASAPAAPTTAAPSAPAQAGPISLQTIREKIGTLTDKKQQCKDLIATYKKADGTPCEKPSDLQESDYAAVYEDLDYI